MRMLSALAMTWLLVITRPAASMITPGAERGLALGAVGHLLAEEFFQKGIASKERRPVDELVGIDIDHRTGGLAHQRREGQLHLGLVRRHLPGFLGRRRNGPASKASAAKTASAMRAVVI